MSQDDELARIFHKDLTLSRNFEQKKYQDDISALEAENRRLADENQALWQCITSYRQNTNLRIANVIAYILSWSDKQRNFAIPEWLTESDIQKNTSISKEKSVSPFIPILTVPNINVQPPSRGASVYEKQPSFDQSTSGIPPSVGNTTAPPQESSESASSLLYNVVIQSRTKSPSVPISNESRQMTIKSPQPGSYIAPRDKELTQINQNVIEPIPFTQRDKSKSVSKAQNNAIDSDWENMILRKSPVPSGSKSPAMKTTPENSFAQPFYANQTVSDRRTGKTAVIEISPAENRTGSEGYGSQLANETTQQALQQSDGRRRVGEPIHTSTPIAQKGGREPIDKSGGSAVKTFDQTELQGSQVRAQKSGSSILHRPIDSIIGFFPVLSEDRQFKLAQIKPSKRLIGEIAFQLDRRILDFVFSWKLSGKAAKRRRFYGYSIANVGQMIRREACDVNGQVDTKKELEMRYRFNYVIRTLSKIGYCLEKHSAFSQDMVNKYGLLSGPPDTKTVKDFGLEDPVILRVLLAQLIKDTDELENELILLDCLCLLAFDDKQAIFAW